MKITIIQAIAIVLLLSLSQSTFGQNSSTNKKSTSQSSNKSYITKVPNWAKKFGAPEVIGLKAIKNECYETTAATDARGHGFQTTFSGSKESLMKEAKRIVKILKIFGRGDSDTYEGQGKVGPNKKYTATVVVTTRNGVSKLEYSIYDLSSINGGIDSEKMVKDIFSL